jgi:hypothetical protein
VDFDSESALRDAAGTVDILDQGFKLPWMSLFRILLCAACLSAHGCGKNSSPSTGVRSPQAVFVECLGIADPDQRRHLAEEMIRDGHLIAMTREQIVEALGEPNSRRMSAAYGDPKYVVGQSGVDDVWLGIHVEDGKVARAEIRSD